MRHEDTWALQFCRPADWTIDLTPPPDWDYEPSPIDWPNPLSDIVNAVGAFFVQVGKGVEAIAQEFALTVERAAEIVDELNATEAKLREVDDKKNGIHFVQSQKPSVKLPTRVFNSGPPLPRLDGRRRK